MLLSSGICFNFVPEDGGSRCFRYRIAHLWNYTTVLPEDVLFNLFNTRTSSKLAEFLMNMPDPGFVTCLNALIMWHLMVELLWIIIKDVGNDVGCLNALPQHVYGCRKNVSPNARFSGTAFLTSRWRTTLSTQAVRLFSCLILRFSEVLNHSRSHSPTHPNSHTHSLTHPLTHEVRVL
jgi:hypothetical protein